MNSSLTTAPATSALADARYRVVITNAEFVILREVTAAGFPGAHPVDVAEEAARELFANVGERWVTSRTERWSADGRSQTLVMLSDECRALRAVIVDVERNR